jgi:hypothetical protein
MLPTTEPLSRDFLDETIVGISREENELGKEQREPQAARTHTG